MLIAHAGPAGVTRRDIGLRFNLPRQLVDQLLAALISTGQVTASRPITATEDDGQTVYQAARWVQALAIHSRPEEEKLRSSA